MKIDAKNLHELHVKHVKTIAPDERFYEVEDAINYALSTYGRLYQRSSEGNWHKVPVEYNKTEVYRIATYTGYRTISIPQLMAEVFFSDYEWVYLYNPTFSPLNPLRWKIEELYALTDKDDLIEVLQAKMEGRTPNLPEDKLKNTFINRFEPKMPINSYTQQSYYNIRSRTTNPNVKKLHPQYEDVTMSEDWFENPDRFRQYILDHQYYHPEKLSLDKDILSLGNKPQYADGTVSFVPLYINNIFKEHGSKLGYSIQRQVYQDRTVKYKLPGIAFAIEGKKCEDQYFAKYSDALIAGRKKRADYIRDVVAHERNLGYMPEYLLKAMLRWADRCELGLIKMWEPDPDKLQKLGVI